MAVQIVPAKAEHTADLGRICYEAFKDISERHGFPTDFHSPEFTTAVIAAMVAQEDRYSAEALLGGQPAGSNFLLTVDEVAGLGPISVDVTSQGHGIGRALMQHAINFAHDNGFESVRLLQDAFNMTSLSLYASVGFDTRHPVALMVPSPAGREDPSVRQVTSSDLDAVHELSTQFYKVSRRNEVAGDIGGAFQPLLLERKGRPVAYLVPGIIGHGVAETEDDMLALVQQAARLAAPEIRRVLCPLTQGPLYRRFLGAGFRMIKVMNLMSLGPYQDPEGVWLPSVLY